MSAHQDTPETLYPRFSKAIHTDERVNATLNACTKCGTALPDAETVGNRAMILYTQCGKCKAVFILDYSAFSDES